MEIVVEQVDVFTEVPFAGNPAAVVLGNPDLDDSLMQAIAREMNLSETAFVGEPNGEGEIPVRFFTPRQEVPLCGHATLAAHYVRARERGESTGSTTQVSPGGRWDVSWEARAAGVFVTMTQRPIEHGSIWIDDRRADLLVALGIQETDLVREWPVQALSTGHGKLIVPLQDPETLSGLSPDFSALNALSTRHGVSGYMPFAVTGEGTRARVFAPAVGIPEDPVNGSGHGPLGAYLRDRKGAYADMVAEGFWSEMGWTVDRPGRVWTQVVPGADHAFVGGFVTPVLSAVMRF